MELEEYIHELQKCPDIDLESELGIYDNYPILLNYRLDSLLDLLQANGYDFIDEIKYDPIASLGEVWEKMSESSRQKYLSKPIKSRFRNSSKTADLLVSISVPFNLTTNFFLSTKQSELEMERQLSDYNLNITLHWPLGWPKSQRGLANAVEEISRLAIKYKIPLCLPHSMGIKDLDNPDYSRLVYYVPNK